jgi:hypothetical protein
MLTNLFQRVSNGSSLKFLNATSQVHYIFRYFYMTNKLILILLKIVNSKLNISLQEYQSKKILEDNGLNIQRFFVATTPEEARDAGKKLSKYSSQAITK